MKIGDYVRTEKGIIGKTTHFDKDLVRVDNDKIITWASNHKEITKISPNIIDLIEIGDYVNGRQVYETGTFGHNGKTFCRLYGNVAPFYEEDIKSIVTKEQFDNMKYEVK